MAKKPATGALSVLFFALILSVDCAAQSGDVGGWSYNTPAGIHSKPVVIGGVIYADADDGTFYALNESTGSLIWKSKLPSKCTSPAVTNDKVVVGCANAAIYGLAKSNGSRDWIDTVSAGVLSSPAFDGKAVYLADDHGMIYAINQSNGKIIWAAKVGGPVRSTLLAAEDRLFASSTDGRLYALMLSNGTQTWNFTANSPIRSSPQLYQDYVYVGSDSGNLFAIGKYSGQPAWTYSCGSRITTQPLATNKGIFFGAADGTFYGLTNKGELLWSYKTGGSFSVDAAIYGGQIYVPDSMRHLLVLDSETGKQVTNLTYETAFTNPPVLSGGRYIMTTSEGLRVLGEVTELSITSLRTRQRHPLEGQTTTFQARVFNNGGLIIDNLTVSLYLDGTMNATQEMRAGPYASVVAEFNLTLPAGRHLVEADITPPGNIEAPKNEADLHKANIFTIGDIWPIYRHDQTRQGVPHFLDSFEKPTERITWTCTQDGSGLDVYSPMFLAKMLGDSRSLKDEPPQLKCRGGNAALGDVSLTLACRISNYTDYAKANEGLFPQLVNLTSGSVRFPEGFNITWACDPKAENRTLPFANATIEYSCSPNPWPTSSATSLWNCNTAIYSQYSMSDLSQLKGIYEPEDSPMDIRPADYWLLWSFDSGAPVYSSPIALDLDGSDDGMLETVFSSSDGTTYALHADGSIYWTYRSNATIHSSPAAANLNGGSHQMIFFGDDAGTLHALAYDGKEAWNFQAGASILSSPLPVDFGPTYGKGLVFGADNGNLYFINARGGLLWTYEAQDKIQSSASIGDVDGDGKQEIIFGSNDNNLYVVSMPPYRYWMYLTSDDITAAPAVYNDTGALHVAFGSQSGVFTDAYYQVTSYDEGARKCVGATCSTEVIPVSSLVSNWAFVLKSPIGSSPLIFDPYNNGSTYFSFGSDDGSLYIMDNSGKKLVRYSANKHIHSSPSAISLDGRTYGIMFGDDSGKVFIISPNGTAIWTYNSGGAIRTSPAVADINGDGVLESVVTSADGRAYVFGYSRGGFNRSATQTAATSTTTTTTTTTSSTATPTSSSATTISATSSTTSTAPTTTTAAATTSTTTLETETTTTTSTSTTTTTTTMTSTSTSTTTTSTTTSTSSTTTTASTTTMQPSTTTTAPATTTTQETSSTTAPSQAAPTSTTTTGKPQPASTNATGPAACESVYYTGTSAGQCANGTALNSVVFMPSTDMDVAAINVINGTELNVTITDNWMTRIAYTVANTGQGAVLNSTVTLKAGELYIISISRGSGCAQKPPSMRTITPDGTWFVQDMWCSGSDSCPMAAELYPSICGLQGKPFAAHWSDERTESAGKVSGSGVDAKSVPAAYFIIVGFVFVLALIFGAAYARGKRQKRGGETVYMNLKEKESPTSP